MNEIQEQLNKYYKKDRISPVKNTGNFDNMFNEFGCPMKEGCWAAAALNGAKSFIFSPRTEGVCVSKSYVDGEYKGNRIPRIVVVSLSAPEPDKEESSSQPVEREPLNPHWLGTLVTVRSLLYPFIAPPEKLLPARYSDDESTEIIGQLFVHLRTAKCCSNAKGKYAEHPKVYENCGCYLGEEVRILKPDVIVTQGNYAHWQAEKHVFEKNAANIAVKEVEDIDCSIARVVNLKKEDNWSVYWLRTIFPYGRFYSSDHAGTKVDCEHDKVGAMRKNLVLYGEQIKKYLQSRQLSELGWENWDRQIEADSESGKLDFLIAEVLEAKEKGTLKEL